MTEAHVIARMGNSSAPQKITVSMNGEKPTFRISAGGFAKFPASPLASRLLDLVDIAGVLLAADECFGRNRATTPDEKTKQPHDLAFEIQVREPTFWSRREVNSAIADAVEFLSEKKVSFGFSSITTPVSNIEYFRFDARTGLTMPVQHVVLFSGGIDSLAGVLEMLETSSSDVAIVTQLSSLAQEKCPRELARILRERYGRRICWIPVLAGPASATGRETDQSMRPYLFAALGLLVAETFGARQLHFFENGVVKFGFPTVSSLTGTLVSQTAHPLALCKLQEILGLVAERPIALKNPYQ